MLTIGSLKCIIFYLLTMRGQEVLPRPKLPAFGSGQVQNARGPVLDHTRLRDHIPPIKRVALLHRLVSVHAHDKVLTSRRMWHGVVTGCGAFRQRIRIHIAVRRAVDILRVVAHSRLSVPVHSRGAAHLNRFRVVAQVVAAKNEKLAVISE